MLRIARALGFLAPIAVAIFVTVVLSTSPTATGAARDLQLLLAALALVAGMTSMALACWSYVGWRLNRIARALEDTLDSRPARPAARVRDPCRAAPGARLQRGRRRLPAGRGAGHPRPHDRRRQPRDAAHHAGGRGGARRAAPQLAVGRLHRHRPLQADQRHLRPQLRRRGAAPGRLADRGQHPRLRPVRPLRRRGVHAHPAGDAAGRGGRAGREAPHPGCAAPAGDRRQPARAGDHQHRRGGRHRLPAAGRRTRRPGRCRHVRRQVAGPQPDLPVPRRRRDRAGASRADLGRTIGPRPPPSGAGPATPPRRRWHRSWLRSRTTADGRRT